MCTFVVQDGDILTVRGARDGRFTYLAAQGGIRGFRSLQAHRSQPGRSWVLRRATRSCHAAIAGTSRSPPPNSQPVSGAHSRRAWPELGPVHLGSRKWLSRDQMGRVQRGQPYGVSARGRARRTTERPNRISDGTVTGNIQIAGSGQPIVILCDRGTVGGYPKVATIISADLGRFAQTPVGGPIHFEAVSVLEAQTVAREFAHKLANIKTQIRSVDAEVSLDALLESNIAGDVYPRVDMAPRT